MNISFFLPAFLVSPIRTRFSRENALTGYVGTETGCQYPRAPAILNKEFGCRGISAITAWNRTFKF